MTTRVSQLCHQTEAPVYFCVSGSQQLCSFSALAVSPSPGASPCLSLSSPELCHSASWVPCRLTNTSGCGRGAPWGMTPRAWIPRAPEWQKNTPQPFPALPQCTLPLCAGDRTGAGHKDKVCGGNCCTWSSVFLLNDRWVHQLGDLGVSGWLRSG